MRPVPSAIAPALAALVVALVACGQAPGASSTSSPVAGSATAAATTTASAGPSTSAAPSAARSEAPPSPPPVTEYVVQSGDTLSRIAARFGVTIEQLQAWNADRYPSLVSDPGSLGIGWTLLVTGDPSVPPPDGQPPASEPPSTALDCNAGSRVPAGDQQVFSTIPNAGPGVALTFDMGGRIDPAVDIMNFLVDNGVCATIFPTGVMSRTDEGQAVLAIIRAHPEQFEVGNHTMYHCDLLHGGGGSPNSDPCPVDRPSAAFVRGQLTDAAAILRDVTGQDAAPYWRPPYGAYDQGVVDAAAAVGYTKTFMWDIDTVDWKPIEDGGPTAEQIAGRVVNGAVNGSNVLMHLGGYNTLDALPAMVSGLRDRGFVLTSLSDLLQ
ncbi:MAG: polysaccharide deacetylase family protein [Chloroflexota bacterium]|nr:polysaccharide deacetylase family protein [Chloroflexota bacterium]